MITSHQHTSTVAPCPECQGLRIPAQVCNGMFLLTEQPDVVHEVLSSPRLHALVCTNCGHVSLYAMPPAWRNGEVLPTPP